MIFRIGISKSKVKNIKSPSQALDAFLYLLNVLPAKLIPPFTRKHVYSHRNNLIDQLLIHAGTPT